MPFPLRRVITALALAAPLALPAPASALVLPLWYGATVDVAASTATFTVQFDKTVDLLTVDDVGNIADTFQFWIDSAAPDPLTRTYEALFGTMPATTQHVIAMGPSPNTMEAIWVKPLDAPGPRDNGGWGSVEATLPFVISGGNRLTFTLPWSAIRETDGTFYYAFETYEFGGWSGQTFAGVSGSAYAVPEPSVVLMMLAGMGVLAAAARKRMANAPAVSPPAMA